MKSLQSVSVYVFLAFGLAWLIALPLWLQGGLRNPFFTILAVAMMFAPAIAAIIASKMFDPKVAALDALAIRPAKGSWGAIIVYSLLAIAGALAISAGALFVGQALGVLHLDLVNFSGFSALLQAKLNGRSLPANMPSMKVLIIAQLVMIPIGALFNAVFAVGEEIGWRGFLLPKLLPMGVFPAVVVSGIIWGLWHAPVILLGYNYPEGPRWLAMACMCGMCIGLAGLLSWLRLRTRSVWPCAVGHGAFNASAGLYALLAAVGEKVDPMVATPLGWTGWLIPLALSVFLFVFFPVKAVPERDATA